VASTTPVPDALPITVIEIVEAKPTRLVGQISAEIVARAVAQTIC